MKGSNMEQKTRKKITHKRAISSAPNITGDHAVIKRMDMFLVPPENIRKYQQEKAKTIVVDKPKTKKKLGITKNKNKKLKSKDVGKILMEPLKLDEDDNKTSEEHQWSIKRNIIKLMSDANKPKKPKKSKKAEAKVKSSADKPALSATKLENKIQHPIISLIKAEGTKAKQLRRHTAPNERTAKPDVLKELKREALQRKINPTSHPAYGSVSSANPPDHPQVRSRTATVIRRQRDQTSPTTPGVTKLKNLFNVFKTNNKDLDIVFSREPVPPVMQPIKKKPSPKKNKDEAKAKSNRQIASGSALIPKNEKTVPGKNKKVQKKKASAQKLPYIISA